MTKVHKCVILTYSRRNEKVIIYVQYYNPVIVDILNSMVDVLCHRVHLPGYSKLLSCTFLFSVAKIVLGEGQKNYYNNFLEEKEL